MEPVTFEANDKSVKVTPQFGRTLMEVNFLPVLDFSPAATFQYFLFK